MTKHIVASLTSDNGQEIATLVLNSKTFKSGSIGFWTNGRLSIDGLDYMVQLQAVQVHSKDMLDVPSAGKQIARASADIPSVKPGKLEKSVARASTPVRLEPEGELSFEDWSRLQYEAYKDARAPKTETIDPRIVVQNETARKARTPGTKENAQVVGMKKRAPKESAPVPETKTPGRGRAVKYALVLHGQQLRVKQSDGKTVRYGDNTIIEDESKKSAMSRLVAYGFMDKAELEGRGSHPFDYAVKRGTIRLIA